MVSDNGNQAAGRTTAGGRVRSRVWRLRRWLVISGRVLCACGVVCGLAGSSLGAAETNGSPPAAGALATDTNSLQLLEAIHQLQAELRSSQLLIEQNALEARVAAARGAEALSNGLQTVERAFAAHQEMAAAQNAKELETLQSANRVMLTVAGSFAAIASLATLMIAWFQWRTSKVWAEISTALPLSRGLGYGPAAAELGGGDRRLVASGRVEEANARALGAMERLERRVQELEHKPAAVLQPLDSSFSPDGNGAPPPGSNGGRPGGVSDQPGDNGSAQIPVLLRQGQSRLKENDLEGALKCFDEVLLLDPNQAEALVKKGAAFERMHKLSEAFECYDRAIKTECSPTIAYLYKGGLCSRLERFKEALECYEQALRSHDEGAG